MAAPARLRSDEHARAYALLGAGVLARFVGTGLVLVLGVAATSLAVRVLGTTAYGTLAFGLSIGALVAGLARLGLEPGLARAVASARAGDADADVGPLARGASALTLTSGVGVAVVVALVVALAPLSASGSTRLWVGGCLGLFCVATNAAAITGALARGLARMALMELPNVVLAVARLAALVGLAAANAGTLRWVAGGYAAAGAATIAACVLVVRRLVPEARRPLRPNASAGLRLLRLSTPFVVTGLAAVAVSRFDVVVLGLTHSTSDVGRYEPALKLVEQAMLWAPLLFIGPYLPAATRLHGVQDAAGFSDLYFGASKLVYVAATPVALVLAIHPEQALHVLYGSGFDARPSLVWILLGGFVVNLALGLNTNALAAAGTRRSLVALGVLGLCSMVVLAGILVPLYGAVGAAAATAATYTTLNLAASVALARAARVRPFRRDLTVTVLSSALPLAALSGLAYLTASPSFLLSLLEAGVASLAWAGLLFAARVLTSAELRRLVPNRAAP